MKNDFTNKLKLIFFALFSLALTACATVEGIGDDLEEAGDEIEEATDN